MAFDVVLRVFFFRSVEKKGTEIEFDRWEVRENNLLESTLRLHLVIWKVKTSEIRALYYAYIQGSCVQGVKGHRRNFQENTYWKNRGQACHIDGKVIEFEMPGYDR